MLLDIGIFCISFCISGPYSEKQLNYLEKTTFFQGFLLSFVQWAQYTLI